MKIAMPTIYNGKRREKLHCTKEPTWKYQIITIQQKNKRKNYNLQIKLTGKSLISNYNSSLSTKKKGKIKLSKKLINHHYTQKKEGKNCTAQKCTGKVHGNAREK